MHNIKEIAGDHTVANFYDATPSNWLKQGDANRTSRGCVTLQKLLHHYITEHWLIQAWAVSIDQGLVTAE